MGAAAADLCAYGAPLHDYSRSPQARCLGKDKGKVIALWKGLGLQHVAIIPAHRESGRYPEGDETPQRR